MRTNAETPSNNWKNNEDENESKVANQRAKKIAARKQSTSSPDEDWQCCI